MKKITPKALFQRAIEDMTYYCSRLDELEEKTTGFKPVRGKDRLWVEKDGEDYVAYWHDKKLQKWVAIRLRFIGDDLFFVSRTSSEPFDYLAWLDQNEKIERWCE